LSLNVLSTLCCAGFVELLLQHLVLSFEIGYCAQVAVLQASQALRMSTIGCYGRLFVFIGAVGSGLWHPNESPLLVGGNDHALFARSLGCSVNLWEAWDGATRRTFAAGNRGCASSLLVISGQKLLRPAMPTPTDANWKGTSWVVVSSESGGIEVGAVKMNYRLNIVPQICTRSVCSIVTINFRSAIPQRSVVSGEILASFQSQSRLSAWESLQCWKAPINFCLSYALKLNPIYSSPPVSLHSCPPNTSESFSLDCRNESSFICVLSSRAHFSAFISLKKPAAATARSSHGPGCSNVGWRRWGYIIPCPLL